MNLAGGIVKKWIKRIVKVLVVLFLLVAILDGTIHLISHTQWFNARVESALEQALGRKVELGPLGANLSGVFAEDIKIAEKGGFEEGVFVQAGRLRVRVSLWHLLHGHTKVQFIVLTDATLRLTVRADGSTSWEDLTSKQSSAPAQNSGGPLLLEVTAGRVRLENLRLVYTDRQAHRTLDINDLTLDVKHFNLGEEFSVWAAAQILHREAGFERLIPLTLKAVINLKQLDLNQAYANIKALKLFYQNSTLTLSGSVQDFENPYADLKIQLRNFSSQMLPNAADLPPFELDKAEAEVKVATDLSKETVFLHHLILQTPGIDLKVQGNVNYGEKFTYQMSAEAELVLEEIGRWFALLAQPYQAVGTVQATATATEQKSSATLSLQEVGMQLPQAGRLSDLNGEISAQETMDFKTGAAHMQVKGKLNANPFEVSLAATQTPQVIEAVLKVLADEVLIPASQEVAQQAEQTAAQTEKTAWPLPPIHLKSDVQLGHVDVPYFMGKDVRFSSDLEGITPDLGQAHGTLRLTTGEGKIQDIYKLTNANPVTKVLFLSLNITGKVFNSLNVLGVLNSLGSGVASVVSGKNEEKPVKTQTILGPDGQPLEVPVEETVKEVSGEMEYDKFDTEVNFTRGLATVKEGLFVSPMMSSRLDGTTDFNTGKIDMTVHAAPGRHEVDGMMPLSLKIGGTVDDPQGSMQLLGSVTSLVGQTVTNNVLSRNVAKGVKGIFGLFKKKEQQETTSPDTL